MIEVADGGGFSALADYAYFLPPGVDLLGSGSTTSVGEIVIDDRCEGSTLTVQPIERSFGRDGGR